ncbi:thrombospondin type 3 repeat-containing protein [Shewanella benthica]|uniref:thrombospondin type 3 repeat-containing protein n=1 Tax=Shewanella benthica TaxID=43661 RepID=UPI001879E299|nr:thrombospondin type 3 repeat-containing protein [Shewanella benthica]MBE7213931.1 hypothetical protein [Shewanella benthica]MCL1061837.1 thrombospondin type 3 repeat-containing protein [Shewanella benthica]
MLVNKSKIVLFLGVMLQSSAMAATHLNWDNNNWNEANWDLGGDIAFQDLDADGQINKYDLDDDGDDIEDIEELNIGTDPLLADSDGDGIDDGIEYYIYHTNPLLADSDGDGLSDYDEIIAGTDPLDPNDSPNQILTLLPIADVNNDGLIDTLGYYKKTGLIGVEVFSNVTSVSLASFTISHEFDDAEVYLLADSDMNGTNEIGVFGFNSAVNRYQLSVYDSASGNNLGVWNWPAKLTDVALVVLEDLSGDGIQEYAISGIHSTNGTRQLIVKDGATKAAYQTFKWPNLWDNTRFVTMTDVTFDGVPEVALYGRHTRLDKGQLFIYDGADPSIKVNVYNWNKLWSNTELVEMDDIDSDGTTDWGQFGQRKDDGRYQWVVKKGHDKRGVIRIFSWPNDLVDVQPMLVGDRTSDNIREVAITGVSSSNGKVFLRINDGKLPNQRIANFSWPANWADVQIVELADLDNDGFNEFALLGYLKTNGKVQLVIKNGQETTEYGRFTLAGDWRDLAVSTHQELGEIFVTISGVEQAELTRKVIVLNAALEVVGSYNLQ